MQLRSGSFGFGGIKVVVEWEMSTKHERRVLLWNCPQSSLDFRAATCWYAHKKVFALAHWKKIFRHHDDFRCQFVCPSRVVQEDFCISTVI